MRQGIEIVTVIENNYSKEKIKKIKQKTTFEDLHNQNICAGEY